MTPTSPAASVTPLLPIPALDTLDREQLAILLAELKALEGQVMARLLVGATAQPAAPRPPVDRMLTIDEAAAILRRGRQWIYRNAHRLPFVKRISRKSLLCSEAGITHWLAARKS